MAADTTQYLLPEGVGLDAAVERLAGRLDLAVEGAAPFERTFYDTFDGRLHAAGLALIGEDGRLVAAEGASYRELAGGPGPAGSRVFAWDLPAGRVRDLVEPIVEVRALVPIGRVRGRRQAGRVRNSDEKTVVRLVVEADVASVGDGEVALRPRVHVIGVRGYDRALGRVRRALAEDLGFEPSELPVHDEAVRADGGAPGGTSSKLDLRLSADEPAGGGAASALGEMLRTIELTLPGVVDDVDSEFLHDFRVAVRRTRSVQRQLAPVFPADRLGWFRGEFRWLGQATGPTRDLDVLLLDLGRVRAELPGGRGAELEPLAALLRRRRELDWRRMVEALESERTGSLLAGWSAFVAELGSRPGGDGAAGGRSLGEVVGRRIRAVYRQMRRAGREIDDRAPADRLHDLRKQGKELRYLLEIFAGLYPAEAVRPTVKALKALQETLGRFQDREVQATMLRALGTELAAAEGGPAALIALGAVLERVEAESVAARAEFGERFAVYASPAMRTLVREAFR
jgi:CHAD domain-containing protein